MQQERQYPLQILNSHPKMWIWDTGNIILFNKKCHCVLELLYFSSPAFSFIWGDSEMKMGFHMWTFSNTTSSLKENVEYLLHPSVPEWKTKQKHVYWNAAPFTPLGEGVRKWHFAHRQWPIIIQVAYLFRVNTFCRIKGDSQTALDRNT